MRVLAALVASIYLPAGGNWFALQPVGSKLVVSGYAQTGADCVWLTVDPKTLGERGPARGSCAHVPGGRVRPVVVPSPNLFRQTVRIANGAVLFRYEDASDTRPEWTYGGGSLWVYDVATTKGPLLVRLSAATGRVLRTIRMPQIYRPLLAANDDGLWLAGPGNGGMSGPAPAPVFHVTASGKVVTVHRGGRAALWITAHGHTVWMEQISGRSSVSLWRFDGPRGTASLLGHPRLRGSGGAVYANGSLWAVAPSFPCNTESVVRVDPRSGRVTRVAIVPALDSCFGPEQQGIAFVRGALFFLDGPRLYRVAVSGP